MVDTWNLQTDFSSGQLSPRLFGRTDVERYNHGLLEQTNVITLPHGGAVKRGGFHYVAEGKIHVSGSDLVTNGDFPTNITGWTDKSVGTGSIAHSTNLMNIVSTDSSNYGWAEQGITTVSGQQYKVTATVGTGSLTFRAGTATGLTDVKADTTLTTGSRTVTFVAESTTTYIGFFHKESATHTLDNVVAKLASTKAIYLKDFQFGVTQAYIIEFGDLYCRFYKDEGQIVDATSGEPIEITTTYLAADVDDLQFAQDADTLYIAHRDYAPKKITRTSHTSWSITTVSFTGTTFPSGFCAGAAGTGTDGNDKNPGAVTFYQERLFWAGTNTDEQTIWSSKTGDFENMDQGTGLADEGVEYVIGDGQVNVIKWLKSSDSMLVGTAGSEFRLHANGAAITPANVIVVKETAHGSSSVEPVIVGRAVLFIQRNGRKLRQLIFDLDVDGFVAPDLTILSEDITTSGINDIAYQQESDGLVWCALDNGDMACMTYDRDQKVVAWHKHTTEGAFESVASIPDPPNADDQLWACVNRTINGISRRYIEYLDPNIHVDSGLEFTQTTDLITNGTFDTAITSWTDKSVSTGSIAWDPAQKMNLTSTSSSAYGWAQQSITTVSGSVYILTVTIGGGTVTCRVGDTNGGTENVNDTTLATGSRLIRFTATATTTYIGFFHQDNDIYSIDTVICKLGATAISGLDHLEGKTIKVTGDNNAVLDDEVVSSGAITASEEIITGKFGLAYTGTLVSLPPEKDLANGSTFGRRKSWVRIFIRIYQTNALTINGTTILFRSAADPMDAPPPVFSGFKDITNLGWTTEDESITIAQSDPVGMTVLSITGEMSVES